MRAVYGFASPKDKRPNHLFFHTFPFPPELSKMADNDDRETLVVRRTVEEERSLHLIKMPCINASGTLFLLIQKRFQSRWGQLHRLVVASDDYQWYYLYGQVSPSTSPSDVVNHCGSRVDSAYDSQNALHYWHEPASVTDFN